MTIRGRVSDNSGKITRKTLQGDSLKEIEAGLAERGLYLLSHEEVRPARRLRGRQHGAVLELTQSLALMIQSGLSLKEAFEVARGLYGKGKTALLVEQLDRQLQRGDSFSQAIASQGDIFPPLYLGMVRVGQKLGRLDRILEPLSIWLKERKELRDKILGAMIYPALVLIMVFAGVSALLIFFLPQLESLASAAGGSSSGNLQQAMGAAKSLIFIFSGLLLLLPLGSVLSGVLFKRYERAKLIWHRTQLSLPLISKFLLTREMLSLSFALSVLTSCGVTLEDALIQSAGVLENLYLKKRLLSLQQQLLKGDALSFLLAKEPLFPTEFSRWTALGERIGSVDRVFSQLKDYYHREMQKILDRILTLAEPVVIMVLGVVLLIIILNVILPLLTMYGGL